MQHEPCERITKVETLVDNIGCRVKQIEKESSVMDKLVTEHAVHIQQQQDWTKDHARVHRDWNMRIWLILIGVVVGGVASIITALT